LKDNSHGSPSLDPWEAAYLRFETPEQEIKKFLKRLRSLGAEEWPKDARVVELFCGRGNGLHALARLGFHQLEGVDLSPRLLAQYNGAAKCHLADCRALNFPDQSKDVLIVQGGLHHLPLLPEDLDRTLSEMRRVLRNTGHVVIVEPWQTPFLRFAHFVSDNPVMRKLWNKLDALATMTEYERPTYENWLCRPGEILDLVRKYFSPLHESFRWGKWNFVGLPRLSTSPASKSDSNTAAKSGLRIR
jgi:ubiquinone/menaquinone biosynthesis C-methylase UbiE